MPLPGLGEKMNREEQEETSVKITNGMAENLS